MTSEPNPWDACPDCFEVWETVDGHEIRTITWCPNHRAPFRVRPLGPDSLPDPWLSLDEWARRQAVAEVEQIDRVAGGRIEVAWLDEIHDWAPAETITGRQDATRPARSAQGEPGALPTGDHPTRPATGLLEALRRARGPWTTDELEG